MINKIRASAQITGFKFINGTEVSVNLIDFNDLTSSPVMITYTNISIEKIYNNFSEEIKRKYSGKMFIGKSSEYGEQIGNEGGDNFENGKFKKNVEPLLPMIDDFLKELKKKCNDISLIRWEMKDVYNLLDFNLDGYIINFVISENV